MAKLLGALSFGALLQKVVGSIPDQDITEVASSIPSRGVYGRQLIDVSLSLKSINISLGRI